MEERRATKTKLIFFFFVWYSSLTCTNTSDTLSALQIIRYNETIISPQETFELGFFTTSISMKHYVGIWYKKISTGTVVWVANRNTPLADTSVELTLTLQGVLIIRNATTRNVLWSSPNSSKTLVRNPIGQLLDTGNFIIYEEAEDINQENLIWQSFDFITDTLLPGMKQGWNLVTGTERHLTSWKSSDDPAAGAFSYSVDIKGYPQVILMDGPKIKFRAGPWNGIRFTGSAMRTNLIYNFTFVLNKREVYYIYNLLNSSVFTRLVMQPGGRIERLLWIDSKQEWRLYLAPEIDQCDRYALCGPFGRCLIDKSPVCECLKGFEPTSPDQWRVGDWSQGCRRIVPINCDPGEGFNKYSNLKLPDTRWSWYNQTMTLGECEKMCKSNCSCVAYTNSNISGTGSGCLIWFGDLIDIRTFAENGDTLYIRLPASELDFIGKSKSSNAGRSVRIIVPIVLVLVILVSVLCLFYRYNTKKKQQQGTPRNEFGRGPQYISNDNEDIELPLFGLSMLLKATNNFSVSQKLGEGGYGPVYKGILEDGQEIAVKRLSKTSNQGLTEFMNEVISISKLQHRNLVKLLGCCIEGTEKMLIYEYMPNKGLDSIIFDKTQSKLLDWPARYHIINGIARGLLYLHQDSRLRIIHRDLKVSNILLDEDMNPKISDFGTARTFGANQIEANTNIVVGTYGYMAPEYAGDGIFSVKSDVYSFGVLVLEVVCGKKNRKFFHKEHCNNLIGYAWRLHNDDKFLQLVAECQCESIEVSQVLRSIHVGLLCVQHDPEDRPTMTSVIMMLGSEGPLPSPKEPGFYVENSKQEANPCSYGTSSSNDISISMLIGR